MRYTKKIAVVSLCGHLFFLIIFLLLHVLRPEKSILSAFTSEYAIGNFGWLLTLGFFGIVTGGSFLVAGLLQYFKASKTSVITLGLWCLGMLIAGLFKTDLPGSAPTPKGLIHAFAALIAFISLGIAMISWGFVFNKNKSWFQMGKLSWFFGVISIILFIIFFRSPPSIRGLTQRMLIMLDISWLLIVNRKLFQSAGAIKYASSVAIIKKQTTVPH